MNYEEALRFLRGADARAVPSVRSTLLHKDLDGNIHVQYHSTNVVTITPKNTWILNTGGWRTVTTKRRMNEWSPANVYQHNHEWYIGGKYGKYDFEDGVEINEDGRPV